MEEIQLPIKSAHGRDSYIINKGFVSFKSKKLLREITWEEPLSNYIGVKYELDSETTDKGGMDSSRSVKKLIYKVVLVHPEKNRNAVLALYKQSEVFAMYSASKISVIRKRCEEYASKLKLPLIIESIFGENEIIGKEDFNLSIKERFLKTNKEIQKPIFKSIGAINYSHETEIDTYTLNGLKWAIIIFLGISLLISVPIFLFLEDYKYIAAIPQWIAIILLFGNAYVFKLRVDKFNVSLERRRFFGLLNSIETIPKNEIEEVSIKKDYVHQYYNEVIIASDNECVNFGTGLKDDQIKELYGQLLWLILN